MFEELPTGISTDPSSEIQSIEETSTAFVRKVEKLSAQVHEKRDALWAARSSDVERAGLVETAADGAKVIDKAEQKRVMRFLERNVESELHDFRRNLADASYDERAAMLSAMMRKAEHLAAIEETWPSPSSYLAKFGLGSTEHSNLIAALSGAGKAELTARAREAVLTGNRILASAVLTVNDRLARHERPFKSMEFAQKVVGAEHGELLGKIKDAKDRVQAALELERLFVTGDEKPTTKIERGLRARQAAGRAKAAA